jgi:hypothetical protein
MTIRTYQPGDETAQVGIYNEACADLPKFKLAKLDEVRRRMHAPDFDPTSRFYAIEDGLPVGYATFSRTGRVSYPWCRKGYEGYATTLFETVMRAMRERGMKSAFAAYRTDWTLTRDFFLTHGFQQAREIVNYVLDLAEMPTPAARTVRSVTPLQPGDLAQVFEEVPAGSRATSLAALEDHLLKNPLFPPSSAFLLRNRADNRPTAVGVLIENSSYADPYQIDSNMPCFRLGAFGTEGMTVKRVNGMFSFLAASGREVTLHAVELLSHAAARLDASDVATFAAQVASDQSHLVRFYQQYFRRQGSFPIYERALSQDG